MEFPPWAYIRRFSVKKLVTSKSLGHSDQMVRVAVAVEIQTQFQLERGRETVWFIANQREDLVGYSVIRENKNSAWCYKSHLIT